MLSYAIPIIAIGCSFLLDRRDWPSFLRGVALFAGGMACAALALGGKDG